MPPKAKFSREEVVKAALEIVREEGFRALTSRALGSKLGSSARPIFTVFQNMDEVCQEVMSAAKDLYNSYLREDMSKNKYPPYKASGMAYIRFARDERELFHLLFMRDRSRETVEENREELRPLIELIKNDLGISEDEAYLFHLEMWIYVHGIATMIATSYLNWDDEFISRVMTDAYTGLKHRYSEKKAF